MIKKYIIILLALWSLSGCSPLVRSEQAVINGARTLSANQSLGQTFVARYDGLQAIRLYLEPDIPGNGMLSLHLRAESDENQDLRIAEISVNKVLNPGYYNFQFDPITDSTAKYFYFHLKIQGDGSVKVGEAGGDTYNSGALYLDNTPIDAQTAFKLSFQRTKALLGVLTDVLLWLGYLGIAFLLYVIPGWAILDAFLPGWKPLHWAEKIALACGLSLSIYPILLLWTDLVGLHLGPLYAWLPFTFGAGAILWRNRNSLSNPLTTIRASRPFSRYLSSPQGWGDIALLILLGMIFASRFWVFRSLEAPVGSDSLHHSLIVQLLHDHNGLFNTWRPYADLLSFTYHFGFHSAAAVFSWVYPMPAYQAVMWVGQILNVLAALAVYPLALRVSRSHWGGLVAVWVAGLASSMPMSYINAGRYTQLAGQVILPAMILLAWDAMGSHKTNWRLIILSWIAIGGLALTHYRVLILSLLFFPAYLLVGRKGRPIGAGSLKLLWIGLGSILLVLPWVFRGLSGRLLNVVAARLSMPTDPSLTLLTHLLTVSNLSYYLPGWLWLVMAIGLIWGLWKQNHSIALIGCWWLLGLLAANPDWLNLPSAGVLSNGHYLYSVYILAGIIAGSVACWIIENLLATSKQRTSYYLISLAGLLALCVSGALYARARLNDFLPRYIAVTRPDLQAADWIRANIPEDAQFLVNSMMIFANWPLASDAGGWLPLTTHRQITLPPMTYTVEKAPRADYNQWVPLLPYEIQAKGVTDPSVLAMLQERGATYVYIGQAPGPLNDDPYKIPVAQLLNDPHFQPIYHKDLVWVFKINY